MNQNLLTDDKELRAIELKYLGNSYAEIAQSVGVEHSTVKSWFMRAGRLHNAYRMYSIEQTQERRDVARKIYTSNLEKAVKTIGELLGSKDERVKLAAAKQVIDTTYSESEKETVDDLFEIKVTHIMEAIKRERSTERQNQQNANNATATI